MKKPSRNTVKAVSSWVSGLGVSTVIGHAIACTTPPQLALPVRALTLVGTFATTAMVSNAAAKQVENSIDEIADALPGSNSETTEQE